MNQRNVVPLDVHVIRIANRDYNLGAAEKGLTNTRYDEISNVLKEKWGDDAGWVQTVLFYREVQRAKAGQNGKQKSKRKTEVKVEVKTEIEVDVNTNAEVEVKTDDEIEVKTKSKRGKRKPEVKVEVKVDIKSKRGKRTKAIKPL